MPFPGTVPLSGPPLPPRPWETGTGTTEGEETSPLHIPRAGAGSGHRYAGKRLQPNHPSALHNHRSFQKPLGPVPGVQALREGQSRLLPAPRPTRNRGKKPTVASVHLAAPSAVLQHRQAQPPPPTTQRPGCQAAPGWSWHSLSSAPTQGDQGQQARASLSHP